MPRLRILNATEREAYDRLPRFDGAGRRHAFEMPASLIEQAGSVQDPGQRIGFLVSAAYFSNARRFFSPRDYHERDVAHAARRLRLSTELFDPDRYTARTRQRHELAILRAHGTRRSRPGKRGRADHRHRGDGRGPPAAQAGLLALPRPLDPATRPAPAGASSDRAHRGRDGTAQAAARRARRAASDPRTACGTGRVVRAGRPRNGRCCSRPTRPPDASQAADAVDRREGRAEPRREPSRDQGDPRPAARCPGGARAGAGRHRPLRRQRRPGTRVPAPSAFRPRPPSPRHRLRRASVRAPSGQPRLHAARQRAGASGRVSARAQGALHPRTARARAPARRTGGDHRPLRPGRDRARCGDRPRGGRERCRQACAHPIAAPH